MYLHARKLAQLGCVQGFQPAWIRACRWPNMPCVVFRWVYSDRHENASLHAVMIVSCFVYGEWRVVLLPITAAQLGHVVHVWLMNGAWVAVHACCVIP